MVAVYYIDTMGGRIESLNSLTRDIWQWCIKRDIWLSACHLPGKENIEADRLSRSTNIDLEWKLNTKVYHEINSLYGPQYIDLFASRINHQLPRYVSYLPDPNVEFADAFSFNGFAFPPFSIVGKVLQKLIAEETDLTLIAPLWTTQHWFPKMLHHIVQDSFIIPSQKFQPLLTQPTHPQMKHPLKKLILGVFSLSGKLWNIQDYHKKLQTLPFHSGELQHKDNIGRISQKGIHFVVNDKLIYSRQLKWI
jgi:hypothetical protein